MLKIDFENQILALFDIYFWPFNKSREKINTIFLISAIIASIWNDFIKFRWHDEKLTSGALADKQQKRGENVENINFSLDTQINCMFSTFSHIFCNLSSRGPDGFFLSKSKFEVSLHFWRSWPTVGRTTHMNWPWSELTMTFVIYAFSVKNRVISISK